MEICKAKHLVIQLVSSTHLLDKDLPCSHGEKLKEEIII